MKKQGKKTGSDAEVNGNEGPFGLARAFTRKALVLLFLSVFFLSMLVGEEISWNSLGYSLIKGGIAAALGWAFLLIVSDALARSIAASAIEAKVARRDGGLLYHFLPPGGEDAEPPPAPARKTENRKALK